jgi:mRNA interferase HigB
MRVIKPSTLKSYWAKHRVVKRPLEEWLVKTKAANWRNINEVRKTYPHADAATVASGATVTIFDIKGNAYRLITAIHYNTGIVFIREFLTHAEYSDGQWKERH